jgi:hypothetical protein
MGYKPWNGLADHHQACTRMVRADYCGDGTAHTLNGRAINLYDGLGVQVDTLNWSFEAEWTPDGARCIVNRRAKDLLASVPACLRDKIFSDCGNPESFTSGRALLMSEFDPHQGQAPDRVTRGPAAPRAWMAQGQARPALVPAAGLLARER